MTLTRYILTGQRKHPQARGDLSLILSAIATASKAVTSAVRRAGLLSLYGLQGSVNTTGDDQKKLDVIANDIWINSLKHTEQVSVMVSEENEEALLFPEFTDAKYAIAFDPLDGSSNIDCNASIGSIWAIYKRRNLSEPPSAADVLQPGTAVICAGYVMYGSSTEMVMTLGEGVQIFSYDPSIGEFLLTRHNVMIPEKPQRIYSFNEGNYAAFPGGIKKYLDFCKEGEKPYSLRYVGSMVADVHRSEWRLILLGITAFIVPVPAHDPVRTPWQPRRPLNRTAPPLIIPPIPSAAILYGGIYGYGPTKAAPGGKLRLLYECIPMSLLMEHAGGVSTTGSEVRRAAR